MMVASIEGHREVLTAIEKRNSKRARQLMETMIERSWKFIDRHLTKSTGP